jgi:SAM-dependent methyltransferase
MSTPVIFTGSTPQNYHEGLGPMFFEPYARDTAARVTLERGGRLLEIAAGTGIVTRHLLTRLPEGGHLVATDLGEPMLEVARANIAADPRLEWQVADACALPFTDNEFDGVVCQFGLMFFPDKVQALAEARRVLAPGGIIAFNVWDRLQENEFAAVIEAALGTLYPADPPHFLSRAPYGYFDRAIIERAVGDAGFDASVFETVSARSRADSPRVPAVGYCQGSPLRAEIEARQPPGLEAATNVAAEAIAERFGRGVVEAKIQAHVILAAR